MKFINANNNGVSIIVCCHNSAKRIADTLRAIANQQFTDPLLTEIILVDNASTDNTTKTAASLWKMLQSNIPFKVVYEPKPGLANARKKGISEAAYEYLLFCDDDNWLFPDYVQKTYEIFTSDPSIAACGGKGIPAFELLKPSWFDDYAEAFAIGSQHIHEENGRLLNLYGAGIAVRKASLLQLEKKGFKPLMTGRTGAALTSSEDFELTYALVLIGERLFFSEELKFYHYMTKERMELSYLKRLFIAFGNDGPVRNLYYANISTRFFHKQIKNWNFHFLLSLFRLLKYSILPPKKGGRAIYFNWNKAYIRSLLAMRSSYRKMQYEICRMKEAGKPVLL